MKKTLILLGILTLTACGDKSLDQRQREEADRELAALQAVSGTYQGILRSTQTGAEVGALSLELHPDRKLVDSKTGAGVAVQAGLLGTATLDIGDGEPRVLNFEGGAYNKDKQEFSVSVPVPGRSASDPLSVGISGVFNGDSLVGHVVGTGSREKASDFELVRNGPMPSTQNLSGPGSRNPERLDQTLIYEGTMHFKKSEKDWPMTLSLINSRSTDQEFLDYFLISKRVDAVAKKNDTTEVFANSRWDQRTGILRGMLEGIGGTPATPFKLYLYCKDQSGASRAGNPPESFYCRQSSTNTETDDNVIFEGTFKLRKAIP